VRFFKCCQLKPWQDSIPRPNVTIYKDHTARV
jgi:hypothetical protein